MRKLFDWYSDSLSRSALPWRQVAVLLAKMEVAGVACAPAVLSDHRATLAGRLAAIKARATQLVGHDFNLSSSSQLAKVLYEDLRLTPPTGGRRRIDAQRLSMLCCGIPAGPHLHSCCFQQHGCSDLQPVSSQQLRHARTWVRRHRDVLVCAAARRWWTRCCQDTSVNE